tara:strand:- start:66 stop:638 length:573 start_codon:yes stop_codon:yes gene_type:complete
MSDIKIEDNFLDQKEFDELQTIIISHDFPWLYNDGIDFEYTDSKGRPTHSKGPSKYNFMFTHLFYAASKPISTFLEKMNPILKIINPIALYRIKANCLTTTPEIEEGEYHHDIGYYDDEDRKTIFPERMICWTTSIFYINTNNGYTEFKDGTKVESVANRLLTFPAIVEHRGTSCTDEKRRIVINFNYFK